MRRFASSTSHVIVDTLIIGGGVMGLSTAYHLSNLRHEDGSKNDPSITVIERDPTYTHNSAVLSAGGIRQQFSLKENVEMSLVGSRFIREHKDELQFQEHGYLFLSTTEQGYAQLQKNLQVQIEAGCSTTEVVSKAELEGLYGDWMNTEDLVAAGRSSSGEGWFDPMSLLQLFKRKACDENKVEYVKGEIVAARREDDSDSSKITHVVIADSPTSTITYHVNTVVNAAGAGAAKVMDILSPPPQIISFPVHPKKRCVFYFKCADDRQPVNAPLTVDKGGVYFRSEGSNFICGVSPDAANDHDCLDVADLERVDHELFTDVIWPTIYNRVPAFGDIKVTSSWAGLYEYNVFDQNAIIGYHPEAKNVVCVNGFSGHGLQQGVAAGIGVSELIERGAFETVDLRRFGYERIIKGEKLLELGIV